MRMGTVTVTSNSTDLNRFYVADRGAAVRAADAIAVQRKQQAGQAQFLTWLSREQPQVYQLMRAVRPELTGYRPIAGLGDATPETQDWFGKTLDFLKSAVPTYFQFSAQKDLIEVNLERAKLGLPPINADQVTPGMNVGLSGDTRTLFYWALGGLVLVGVVLAARKR